MSADPDVVESSTVAVLPGAVLRGGVVGLLFTGFASLYLFVLWEWTGRILGPLAGRRALVALALGPATVCLVVALAAVGYSRRRYDISGEELTEFRGLVRTRTRSVPFDEITDVHLSRTRFQSLFDAGTIRINDGDGAETGEREAMRLRFVERPEAVYERLRDGADRSVSVPRLTVEPNPLAAARTSASRGLVVGAVGGFVPVVLTGYLLSEFGVAEGPAFLAGVGAVLLAVVARAAHVYSVYDERQYEIYDDRVEAVGGGTTTAVRMADVHDAEVYESVGRFALRSESDPVRLVGENDGGDGAATEPRAPDHGDLGGAPGGSRGWVNLLDEEGETLLSLRYVADVDRIADHLAPELNTVGSDRTAATDAGPQT